MTSSTRLRRSIPSTPYGESKIFVERDVKGLADAYFTPTFMRNATAYGASPRLRLDVVLNDFVAAAVTTGCIFITSDGDPLAPDRSHSRTSLAAITAVLAAPQRIGAQPNFQRRRRCGTKTIGSAELAEM